MIHVDEQFIKNPENDQNNYHDNVSTEPCINESPAPTKSTIQETLGKVNSNKSDNNEPLSHPSELTLTTPPPPPPPSIIYIDNSNQETTNIPLEPVSTNQPQLTFPKKNDTISIMCDDKTWSHAKVLERGGKSTGKHKNCINVRLNDPDQCINLDTVHWKNVVEDINIVQIPKSDHNGEDCIKAKLEELEKLKQFNTYEEVAGTGQFCISTTWVLWKRGDLTRARLVARGYEELEPIQKDSSTASRDGFRTFLFIVSNHQWQVKTPDIKSAFLQGQPLERDVYIDPPKKAKVKEGSIWHLNTCLYGLNDAVRLFYLCQGSFAQIDLCSSNPGSSNIFLSPR